MASKLVLQLENSKIARKKISVIFKNLYNVTNIF